MKRFIGLAMAFVLLVSLGGCAFGWAHDDRDRRDGDHDRDHHWYHQ